MYLVEAADDICYELMDLEDASKLHIISTDTALQLFLGFFSEERREHLRVHCDRLEDPNEKLAYLRSCAIGALVDACAEAFMACEPQIMVGELQQPLIRQLPEPLCSAYAACADISLKQIYRARMVLDIELSGYRVISELLRCYIHAAFSPTTAYSHQLLNRVPSQYDVRAERPYDRILAVLDFISGMTDVYALDLYRMIQGIEIPKL